MDRLAQFICRPAQRVKQKIRALKAQVLEVFLQ